MTSAVDERGAEASGKFRFLLRAHPHSERETAPMRAEAPAKLPSKLIDCRDPL
jgi:hypothetical protein